MPKLIDVHGHFVPQIYLDALEKHNCLLADRFPPPVWNPEKHEQFIEDMNIAWSLFSLSSPNPYFGDTLECKELCRAINEEASAFKKKHPGKVGFNAVLPLPDVDAAIEEAKYALDHLNADGIKFASNTAGQYLGDPALDPLFEELDRRGVITNIHPTKPVPIQQNVFSAGPVSLYEFIADTTRCVMNMIANGVLERYPNVKVIVPHNGSFLPNIYNRFQGLLAILGPKGLMPNIDVKANFAKLYFDCAGHPVPLIDFLLTCTDVDHILYGSDFPYTGLPEMKHNIELMEERYGNSDQFDLDKIYYKNAEKLFGIEV